MITWIKSLFGGSSLPDVKPAPAKKVVKKKTTKKKAVNRKTAKK